ncbi:Ig-like domain-containing protein [Citrobacter amalonaticus]|nr:Ig-like domain-containing protein [Citrobacter amalonaticus]
MIPAPLQGDLKSGQTTDDTQPGLRGFSTPNSTVDILVDGVVVASNVPVDENGNWNWTSTATLTEGLHTFEVIDTVDGSKASAVVNITVDLTPPEQPSIGSVTDDVAPGTGTLTSGQTTNDPRPTLSGNGTNGETITIYDGSTPVGQVQVVNGTWSFTPPTGLEEGSHNLTITATDAAGNTSVASEAFVVVVDTTPPPLRRSLPRQPMTASRKRASSVMAAALMTLRPPLPVVAKKAVRLPSMTME